MIFYVSVLFFILGVFDRFSNIGLLYRNKGMTIISMSSSAMVTMMAAG